MTGTPLDLTPFGSVITALGWLYWLLAAAALWWVLRGTRPWKGKLLRALPVVLVFGFIPGRMAWEAHGARQRLNAAVAHFEMRCKSAGEKITRTVENVEGVVWMKWREKRDVKDDFDQFKLFDPYGRDCDAEDCIEQLLRATKGIELDPNRAEPFHAGFQFVESVDPATNQLIRYTRQLYRPHDREARYTEKLIRAELVKQPISQRTARYGIVWDDISSREDREHWIAGGSLKVIDLQTNEMIAERIGYMMDPGLGSRAGFRTPWAYALRSACPPFPTDGTHSTRSWPNTETNKFVSKILKPTRGD